MHASKILQYMCSMEVIKSAWWSYRLYRYICSIIFGTLKYVPFIYKMNAYIRVCSSIQWTRLSPTTSEIAGRHEIPVQLTIWTLPKRGGAILFWLTQATCAEVKSCICLAVTMQLYEWFSPSIRLCVCGTFFTIFPSLYHHEIFRSYHQWQKWCPCKRLRSEVRGQGRRGQNICFWYSPKL